MLVCILTVQSTLWYMVMYVMLIAFSCMGVEGGSNYVIFLWHSNPTTKIPDTALAFKVNFLVGVRLV